MRRDAAGQRYFAAVGVMRARLGALFRGREFILERVDAPGSQRRELGLALFDQGIGVVHTSCAGLIKHGAGQVVQGFDARRAERGVS